MYDVSNKCSIRIWNCNLNAALIVQPTVNLGIGSMGLITSLIGG